jgi:hypothetical protein
MRGAYFETDVLFPSQPFGCVGRLRLLDVAIPDLQFSRFF